MDITLQKTITFMLFIGVGLLLKLKFPNKSEITGIKKVILNLALPATIFIALLGIEVKIELLALPLLALVLNFLLYAIFPYILPLLGIPKDSAKFRTARLLIPSLAPGLSCFPFVLEYLGDNALAKAAMADLGNKIFVLIFLYIIAMRWYYAANRIEGTSQGSKIKSLLKSLIAEPVNLFIIVALLLVSLGINMDTLPFFISEGLSRLSIMMTPLVLLFIGLAVNVKKRQFVQVFAMLLLRAGFVVLLCVPFIAFAKINSSETILLTISFALSACSFWPFAHISAVDLLEGKKEQHPGIKTFDGNFAVNILALSFPVSVILILGLLSSGKYVANIPALLAIGISLIVVGCLPILYLMVSRGKIRFLKLGEKKAYREDLTTTVTAEE
ncbi:MAG: permease [Cytophagaceae bacterium]|nr:permease [Cytophagaceae bacterium]|tara:strand:- start:1296 stop:2453 length:1158 start_codon:yes stop_codon:yes gene_type:complete